MNDIDFNIVSQKLDRLSKRVDKLHDILSCSDQQKQHIMAVKDAMNRQVTVIKNREFATLEYDIESMLSRIVNDDQIVKKIEHDVLDKAYSYITGAICISVVLGGIYLACKN